MAALTRPNDLGHSGFTALTARDLARIPPYAFAALDLQHCQWLTPAQTGVLSPSQVAALSPTQIAALAHADRLPPSVLKVLSAQQAGALCTRWEWLSGEQLNALSPSAIAALPLDGVARLSKRALPFLAPSALRAMTPAQMSAIAHPDWLPDATVQAMTPEQVRAIRVNWRWMSAGWINALTPRAVAAIPASGIAQWAPGTVAGLDAQVLKAMNDLQLAAIPHAEVLNDAASEAFAHQLGLSCSWPDVFLASTQASLTDARLDARGEERFRGLAPMCPPQPNLAAPAHQVIQAISTFTPLLPADTTAFNHQRPQWAVEHTLTSPR